MLFAIVRWVEACKELAIKKIQIMNLIKNVISFPMHDIIMVKNIQWLQTIKHQNASKNDKYVNHHQGLEGVVPKRELGDIELPAWFQSVDRSKLGEIICLHSESLSKDIVT